MQFRSLLVGKRLVILIAACLLFLLSLVGGYLYFTVTRMVVDSNPAEQMLSPVPEFSMFDLQPIPTPEVPTSYNLLLIGYGGGGHEGGELSDSLIVAHLDPLAKRVALVSVPRDLWITLPTGGSNRENRKINHAYVLGGSTLAKQAVSTVVGLPIQYFISVSFDGITQAIDELDGVTVDVPVAFDDYFYPVPGKEIETCGKTPEEVGVILTTLSGFEIDKQFPCRFEQLHFDAGKQLMDGERALKFVRSRHSAQHGGDFARSQRQQALLLGIRDRLLSLGALNDAVAFFNQLSHTIQTDLNEEAILVLKDSAGNLSDYQYRSIQLTTDNALTLTTSSDGQSILVPKEGAGHWARIHAYIAGAIENPTQE